MLWLSKHLGAIGRKVRATGARGATPADCPRGMVADASRAGGPEVSGGFLDGVA